MTVKPADFQNNVSVVSTTIASGQTTSLAIQILGSCLESIQWDPSAMTSTTATIQGSFDGTNFFPIVAIGGAADSITVAAAKITYINPQITRVVQWIKIVGGSTEAALRNLTLGLLPAPG